MSEPTVLVQSPPTASAGGSARIVTEAAWHGKAFERLVDRVFGPGRFAKASQRLREGNVPLADLCFIALDGETVVGGVRLWPARIGTHTAVFLGPVAVDPDFRSQGLGGKLIQHACAAAAAAGHGVVVLVGDRAFFEPLGFACVPPGRLTLPGPADPARILWRELSPGACAALSGAVTVR